ncbi:hypothetical protein [Pelagibius marinus]|uniref:hypothetical protein n=1 Tax=Pelagibius marinus TaxID=2762760 RepID=UPI00187244FA|nr:hypothetical protein [Pelagibius marinus]
MTDAPDHRTNSAQPADDEQHASLSSLDAQTESPRSPFANLHEVNFEGVGTGSPPSGSKARVKVITDWPERFPISEAEVLLASTFFADLLSEAVANDNHPQED